VTLSEKMELRVSKEDLPMAEPKSFAEYQCANDFSQKVVVKTDENHDVEDIIQQEIQIKEESVEDACEISSNPTEEAENLVDVLHIDLVFESVQGMALNVAFFSCLKKVFVQRLKYAWFQQQRWWISRKKSLAYFRGLTRENQWRTCWDTASFACIRSCCS
jgi:hypothetical protein